MELQIQYNSIRFDNVGDLGDGILVTPPIDGDYWLMRVPLSDKQAVVCFPKFLTIGIGFQQEDDWNTNLPWTCGAEKIFDHIRHNKGDESISDEDCLSAIKMLQVEIGRRETP